MMNTYERLRAEDPMKLKAYRAWKATRARLKGDKHYQHLADDDYDPRWLDFEVFLADMGLPKEGQSIDRIDNNRGYWPDNCRWATASQQTRNRSITTVNEVIVRAMRDTFDYGLASIAEIARIHNVDRRNVWSIVHRKSWQGV